MVFKQIMAVMLGAVALASQAQVVSGTNVLVNPTSSYGANFTITVLQEPTGNPTTIWLQKTDASFAGTSTITPVTWNVDEEADYYLMKKGAVLSPDTIASGLLTPLFTTDHRYTIQVGLNDSFYLGIVTGVGGIGGVGPNRNVFGWVELQNASTGLSRIDSAMAYGFGGIVVGTTNTVAVPESGTGAQLMLGLIGLAGLATAGRMQRKPASLC